MLDDDFQLFAISEERLSRVKHDGGYPSTAIQSCLSHSNLMLAEIEKISVGFGLEENRVGKRDDEKFCSFANNSNFERTPIGKKNPLFFDHQYIHARTSYALSGFKKALVICLDGGGVDNGKTNSGGIFVVDNGVITPIKYFSINASLGNIYGAITEICGFRMVDGEGKTMTLSPFGEKYQENEKGKIYEHMCKVFPNVTGMDLQSNGGITLDGKVLHDFAIYDILDTRLLLLERLYHKNLIAWAAQKRLEEIVIEIIKEAVEYSGIKNVALGGGVFLNMIMNMRIKEAFAKKIELFFNPICNDLGNAIGATLEHCFQETGKNISFPNMSLYLGNSYSDEEVIASSKKFNFKVKKADKIETAIDLIDKAKIIGWFQGRAELGARALGHRSIVSLATEKKFKDIVNNKVKKRESWRPFCPTIIEEKSSEFLEDTDYLPYMIVGSKMIDPESAPAVCHVDGTTRPQILKKEDNPDFHEVVKGAGGIVLNTSFNLAGEPIVETPYHALLTLKNSDLDALVINDYLIEKN